MKAFAFVSEAARADYLALPRPAQRRFGRCLRALQEGNARLVGQAPSPARAVGRSSLQSAPACSDSLRSFSSPGPP